MANVSISQATNTTPLSTDLIPIARVGSTTPYNVSVSSIANGSVSSFTQGSVLFVGSGGVYSQNNAALFWNNSTNRFGVNTNAPLHEIDVVGDYATVASRGYTTSGANQVAAQAGDYWSLPSYTATLIQTYGSTASGNLAFLSTIPAAGSGGLLFTNTTNALVYTNGSCPLIFGTNGLERVRITSAGNVGIGTASPGSPLDVVGNINASYISTTSSTSTTPTLSFNASNTSVAKGATVSGSYVQDVIQNKSATAGASANYVVSPNNGTDSTYYGEFGINSSVFSASTPSDFFSLNNQTYFSSHDGDVAVGSGNGFKTYFPWGATAASAHVINASGAIGFSTNLGTTLANSGTIGFGTSGQALITAGSGAAPAWGNVASPYSAASLFGTGADGAVTISSGTTTLTRDAQYTNLTLSGSGAINTNGYRVFVSGTLDISVAAAGAIQYNSTVGNNASGATGGATANFGNIGGTAPGIGYVSNSGGTGNTTTGTAGSNSVATVAFSWSCGQSGAGGAGGAGVSVGATGISGTIVNSAALTFNSISLSFIQPWGGNNYVPGIILPSVAGGGGGQGGGDGTNAGGGGGSPSFGAGMVYVSARFINRGASTAVGAIQAKSGAGGNGANGVGGTAGGGGGGGAGTGGTVIIITESLLGATATNAIDVSGGAGGNGGNSPATNKGGTGGRGGGSGSFFIHNLSAATYTAYSPFINGSFATTATTTTGTTGGAGATARGNL
jgi:hypothetical protein